MDKPKTTFTAVVLAADRGPGDPVAKAAGVPCKALTPVGGRPMVLRVLDALESAQEIDASILCGPPQSIINQNEQLRAHIASGKVRWVQNQTTPSTSTYHVLQSLPETTPVLVTTADHALLSARIADHFCSEARATGCDLVVGLVSHEIVKAAYPDTKRTVTKLRDGAYCSCNLFAFVNPRARIVADFWRQVERKRKNPMSVVGIVGWMAIVRYLLGRLSLAEGLSRLSSRLDLKVGAIVLPFPEAAVDVDKVSDWMLVQKIVAGRNS